MRIGRLRSAKVAGPPSPLEPRTPVPTTVVITESGVEATFNVARPRLPTASRAVTVIKFIPGARGIPLAAQRVPPESVAAPVTPRLVAQVTPTTALLSLVVP